MEKSLERNIRRSFVRNERAREICEVTRHGRVAGVMTTDSPVCSTSGAPAVDFEHEDVAKYRNSFSLELGRIDI
jgi:hypothetical protein